MNKMLKDEVAAKMAEIFGPMSGERILEIGTGWAESAEFLSQLKPKWKIYTIDGFGMYGDGRIYARMDHDKIFDINSRLRKCGNVIQILGDSASIPWELPLDGLFLDGDHRFEGCMADFNHFWQWVKPGGYVIFDDFRQPNNPANGVAKVVDYVLERYHDEFDLFYSGYYCAILQRKAA